MELGQKEVFGGAFLLTRKDGSQQMGASPNDRVAEALVFEFDVCLISLCYNRQ